MTTRIIVGWRLLKPAAGQVGGWPVIVVARRMVRIERLSHSTEARPRP